MYLSQAHSPLMAHPAPKCIIETPTMDTFIRTQLRPVDECIVCTEPFSATHKPVALDCKHIFGHKCIEKWVRNGRGNNASCPVCRHVLIKKTNPQPKFDAPSIWKRLCELPLERLHEFMIELWSGIRELWQRKPDGRFTITELLDTIIFPALIKTGAQAWSGAHDALTDAYNLIAASWDSLGRPERAEGLAIPLVRLTRLMSSASSTAPRWLTSKPEANRLFWKANECLGLTEENISWDTMAEAARLQDSRHFPLLHLYTLLVSHSIETAAERQQLPARRYEVMNLVVERCCKKIGKDCYVGRPSSHFKDVLLIVFEELRRYHLEKDRQSFRGYEAEAAVVKSVWAVAGWIVDKKFAL